jgi:hypothetical protein
MLLFCGFLLSPARRLFFNTGEDDEHCPPTMADPALKKA